MSHRDTVHALLDRAGVTYAAEAAIQLDDKPAPLFQLLMLTELLSARVPPDIAIAATAELVRSGYRSAQQVAAAERRELVDVLGRGHHHRDDGSIASQLGATAAAALDKYHGDLREIAEECAHHTGHAGELIQQFAGIGPAGGDIFLREVQQVWPWVRPYFGRRALRGAERIGLPPVPEELARMTPYTDTAEFAAALVRVGLDDQLAGEVRADVR